MFVIRLFFSIEPYNKLFFLVTGSQLIVTQPEPHRHARIRRRYIPPSRGEALCDYYLGGGIVYSRGVREAKLASGGSVRVRRGVIEFD